MTLYQAVRKTLRNLNRGITFPELADEIEADPEATRLVLHQLRTKGQAIREAERADIRVELWRSR